MAIYLYRKLGTSMKGSHIRVTRRNVCKRDQNGIKANQCGSTFELLDGPTAQPEEVRQEAGPDVI